MRVSLRILFLILAFICLPSLVLAQIQVLNPVVIDTTKLGIVRPQGITFHSQRNTLFVVTMTHVFELSPSGDVLNSFSIEALTKKAEGIAYDPATGQLLISAGTSTIFHIEPTSTYARGAFPIDVAGKYEIDDLAVDPEDGTIWIVHEEDGEPGSGKTTDTQRVIHIDRAGRILSQFSTTAVLSSLKEPQGLGFFGSHLLVTDDSEATQTIYLFSRAGALIEFVLDTTTVGVVDPEGIVAFGNRRIAVVSDKDSKLLFFDAGIAPVPQNFLAVPTFVDIPNTFVGVAAFNSITAGNTAQIDGLRADGQMDVVTRPTAAIPSLGQTAFLTRETTDSSSVQTLLLKGQSGPIQGFFMLGDFNLRRLDGIGKPLAAATSLFLPLARRIGTESTVLSILNPSEESSSQVAVDLFSADGKLLQQAALRLSPRGSFIGGLERLFGASLVLEDGFVKLSATAPVQSFTTLVRPESFSTIAGQVERPIGKLLAPHFFVGPQGTTKIRVLNLESQPVSLAIHAIGNDAVRMADAVVEVGPQSVREFDLTQLALEGKLRLPDVGSGKTIGGYLELDVRGSEARRIIAVVTYVGAGGDMVASLPFLEDGERHMLFLHVAQSPAAGVFHGLALVNLSSKENRITVQAYDQSGNKTREVTLTLPPKHRAIGLLNEELFFGPGFEQTGGYLRVISDSAVASFSLFGGAHFLSAIEGQPTLNNRSFSFLRQ